ncbi:hypothetical protein SKAU_G00266730 [Synaphobranchus kaupii]|uniref:Uncharacterized protein n=1 Tax=Synaphobranchus kaupii TaxID=118154 RepID=A0A9Q1EZC7_SYNKA|nr:hypothetical protein SKAU_G00266730 [Synaphobranchus kaupii]
MPWDRVDALMEQRAVFAWRSISAGIGDEAGVAFHAVALIRRRRAWYGDADSLIFRPSEEHNIRQRTHKEEGLSTYGYVRNSADLND